MAYVVNDNCIKCKHLDCAEVCPVDCFYEGENMLVINPDECIDCDICSLVLLAFKLSQAKHFISFIH